MQLSSSTPVSLSSPFVCPCHCTMCIAFQGIDLCFLCFLFLVDFFTNISIVSLFRPHLALAWVPLLPCSIYMLAELLGSSPIILSHFNSPLQAKITIPISFQHFPTEHPNTVKMRAISIEMGPIENGDLCTICHVEIMPTEPRARHFYCEAAFGFHLECLSDYLCDDPSASCPDCHGSLEFNPKDSTKKRPETPKKSQPPLTPPNTAGQPDTREQQIHSESGDVWEDSDPFKEPKPEIPYLQCTFQSQIGLMDLISSAQASIQTLTGNEVWELHLSPTDKKEALRLSSTLTGFSRIFYHAPGQPRNETTFILTHQKVNEPFPGLGSSRDTSNPSAPKAELDELTDMINTIRRTNNDAVSKAGQWVSPPTTCGIFKINGRKAKIITGMIWLKPSEDDEGVKRRR
jgi:hypothetical protein